MTPSLGRGRSKTFIIAEAGVNHNGRFDLARRLIDAAAWAGADAVKFQTFVTEENQSSFHLPKQYLKWAKSMELSFEEFSKLARHCRNKKIQFLSAPFEGRSADFLDTLDVAAFKIASGEITNLPLLRHIAKKARPIILSTGMADMREIAAAVSAIKKAFRGVLKTNTIARRYECFRGGLILLHCISEYPASYEHMNLLAMNELYQKFRLPVGLSDHSIGPEIPLAAVTLGACVIEKHFTLDKKLKGPDHAISVSPDELKNTALSIRNVERALGDGRRALTVAEKKLKKIARKSIVAAEDLKKGAIIKRGSLYFMRPGKGISPADAGKLLGRRLLKDLRKDEMFSMGHLE